MRRELIGGVIIIAAGIAAIAVAVAYSAWDDPDPLACDVGADFASHTTVSGRDGAPPFSVGEPIEIRYSYVNCRKESVALRYSDNERARFEAFQWYGDVGTSIWSTTANVFDLPDEQLLAPGEIVTWTGTWSEGAPKKGQYSAVSSSGNCTFQAGSDCPHGGRKFFEVED